MPSLKAQEHRKSKVLQAVVSHGRRMTNSIRPLCEQCVVPAFHSSKCVEKLRIKISIKLTSE
jgi:endonuclease III